MIWSRHSRSRDAQENAPDFFFLRGHFLSLRPQVSNLCLSPPPTPPLRCGFLWVRSTIGCAASDSPGSRQHLAGRTNSQQLRAQARAGPLIGRGVGARGQPAGAASSAPREAAAPARPGSSLFPPRPTQPRLRPAAAPSTRRPAGDPGPSGVPAKAEPSAWWAPSYSPMPPLPPRVLTRLQGAEQPGRGPRNAAALLEHIAQDGAHAAATAAAATTTLPLQASPSTSQGAGQLVLPHRRAPWDPALRLGSRRSTGRSTGAVAWRALGAWWARLVEGPWEAARMLGNRGTRGAPWEPPRVGRQAGICSAEPAGLRLGEGLGRGGGRERSSAGRRRRRSRPQSRHHHAQAGQP